MKSIFNFLAKTYLLFMGLGLIVIFIGWHTQQDTLITLFEVTPLSALGLSMLKGDIGGVQIAIAVFVVLYFLKGKRWLYPLMIVTGCIVFSRLLTVMADGSTPLVWMAICSEVIGILAAWWLSRESYEI